MKTKIHILFLFVFALSQSCKAQEAQTPLPRVENHLNGELDYAHGVLDLVKRQANGEEISLGKIDKDGTIHFNLPAYDIKALYDSIPLQHYKFQQLFNINSECKDRDPFAKTPFDAIYSEKTNAIFIKKYGIKVAVLEATTEEPITSSTYFWFYIDRAISFKDGCSKVSSRTGDIYANVSADIAFEKGWNFIEENLETVKTDSQGDSLVTHLSKIQFTKSSPANKKVKWRLRQIQEDEKIETAKRLDKLTPITKKQFEKWVPNKLDDLSVATKEYGKPPKRQKNKNNMHLIYANKAKNKEIDLYLIDCAKSPDDMEMVDFAYAMENRGKDEKDMKPYVAQHNEREKAMRLLYRVEDRIIINASAKNIEAEELWRYIKKLNIKKLLKKQ